MSELKDRIEVILKDKGLNQSEFAAALNCTPAYVSQLRNGKRTLANSTALLIQKAFGFSAEWLLTGKGEPKIAVDDISARREALIKKLCSHTDAEIEAILAFMDRLDALDAEEPKNADPSV